MSAGTSASFCLIVCFLVCSSGAQTKITAELGKEVVLPCKVPNKYSVLITAVKWIRPEQDPDYVLLYRDGHFDPHSQHPSYQNRVDLQDKEMKDRDVSLILKNVMKEDTGTYECRVYENGKNEPINIINLEVLLSGDKDGGGRNGVIAGSVVGVILLLLLLTMASIGFLIYRQNKKKPHFLVPPDDSGV